MSKGFLADVQDDDGKMTKEDALLNDDAEDTGDVELEELLASIKDEDAEDPDDETTGEQEEESEESEEEKPDEGQGEPEITPEMETIINQRVVEQLNRIVPERLKRDRKTQQVTHLEQITGMPLEEVTNQIIRNMAEAKADELGISPEEAMEMLKPKIENAGIKANAVNQKQESDEINAAMQKVKYLQDKTDYIKKPKLAKVLTKEIISEVDTFTQNGSILSFVDGLNYVLGSKFTNGELISKLQSGAEKKAQANIQKKVVAPQTKGSGAVKNEGTLSREEKIIAAQLGISEKEYAAEKYKEINRKQRKLR
jgi:hypothetical protein